MISALTPITKPISKLSINVYNILVNDYLEYIEAEWNDEDEDNI